MIRTRNRKHMSNSDKVKKTPPSMYALAGLFATGGAHAKGGLEGVINPPLQTGKGANHDNTSADAASEEVNNAELAGDLAEALALVGGLAEL